MDVFDQEFVKIRAQGGKVVMLWRFNDAQAFCLIASKDEDLERDGQIVVMDLSRKLKQDTKRVSSISDAIAHLSFELSAPPCNVAVSTDDDGRIQLMLIQDDANTVECELTGYASADALETIAANVWELCCEGWRRLNESREGH